MSVNTMNDQQRRQYQQQQQHQQQQQNKDLEMLRRNYRTALSELTFNSKPIITNLTIMAQENQAAAAVIVKEIENQLRNNAAGQKLPVLYLIDSICKNVGGVYISIFGRNMVNTFLDAYTLSDANVRKSFERLLQTWKNGLPGGRPVFPRHIIEPIERSIMYIREKQANQQQQQQQSINIHVNPNFVKKDPRLQSNNRDPRLKNATPPQQQATKPESSMLSTTTANLLSQLQSILPQQSPMNAAYQPIMNALNMPSAQPVQPIQTIQPTTSNPVNQLIGQIKAILPTLPAAQANSIEQYISQIASTANTNIGAANGTIAPSIATAVAPIINANTVTAVGNSAATGATTAATVSVSTPTISHSAVSSSIINSTPTLVNKSPIINTASILSPAPYTASPPAATPVNTAELLKSLTSMGYLDPTPGKPVGLESMGPFLLDSKDLQIPRPGAIELLYSAEPLQCKQCGFRYPKTEKGQQKMDAHLDSHFRQNRRMKERVKRGLSRSWFVTVDEWIHGEGGESTSQQVPTFLHDGVSQSGKSNEGDKAEETIDPDKHTVVRHTDERKTCPICGETFVDFWNDDEEEWMYKNAVLADDKIYHATCHADVIKNANSASNNIASKRKSEEQESSQAKHQRIQ
ncbi:hypothetical protein BCV72DRAFT_94803 [Rhizopus microsporus var. microsporus]|uniref:CID domain-containing protein n=2 Tax=Rhizopus microsporus TaxID=58291 RepID=A0A2G4STK5_RHIZD|nr:uncharacterized protein RHIMIDRAFT_140255 [Rhizopus microsporus ATCC 52813]ORE11595.1 hypothetical protein BCV72DRAFT_94803 [Rhizopus microsporus var. microsporus]PHZ12109.1 hypothetical protein RHIMIDRAFT_140255 [Rhizopus microsporus ATCC 52813]